MGDGILKEFGVDMYSLLHLKWIINKDLPYSTWNSAQCYVQPGWKGSLGGEWIHEYVWLGHLAVHLKLPQHCLLGTSLVVQVSLIAQLVRNLPSTQETPVRFLVQEDPLEKG